MKHSTLEDKSAFEHFYEECEFAKLALGNLKKYVDKDLDPLYDTQGNTIYEVEVLSKLSSKAQEFGRKFFEGILSSLKKIQ